MAKLNMRAVKAVMARMVRRWNADARLARAMRIRDRRADKRAMRVAGYILRARMIAEAENVWRCWRHDYGLHAYAAFALRHWRTETREGGWQFGVLEIEARQRGFETPEFKRMVRILDEAIPNRSPRFVTEYRIRYKRGEDGPRVIRDVEFRNSTPNMQFTRNGAIVASVSKSAVVAIERRDVRVRRRRFGRKHAK